MNKFGIYTNKDGKPERLIREVTLPATIPANHFLGWIVRDTLINRDGKKFSDMRFMKFETEQMVGLE